MKKKLLLFVVLLMGVIFITGCENDKNKSTISLKDDKLGYETVFSFSKSSDFVLTSESDSGKYKEIVVKNASENLTFDMYYTQEAIESYNVIKESRTKDKNYKEYKFGNYEAYSYGKYDEECYLVIKLKEEGKDVIGIFVSIENMTYDNSDVVFEKFDRKEVLDFFDDMKLNISKADKKNEK